MSAPADESLPSLDTTTEELAGLDVLPDSYRVDENRAIPDGYIVSRHYGFQERSTPPEKPRDVLDANRLERAGRWAGARKGWQMWAALAFRHVRHFRGDSRARRPSWLPRRTTPRTRACAPRRARAPGRRQRPHRDAAGESDVDGAGDRAARACSWR